MTGYPPEPWHLTAHTYVGLFVVPVSALPTPPAGQPISVRGRTLVSAAFLGYEEPGDLTYDEVLCAVLVRRRWRPCVSITHIWVNSPASRDGGRELWAIPKELGSFEVERDRSYAAVAGDPIATLQVSRSRLLPFGVPLRFSVLQSRGGRSLRTSVRGRGRLGVASATWSLERTGPLGFLAGRRPLGTVAVARAALIFGR